MKDYTNLDLALAVANCKNIREIMKLAKVVSYLWESGESINKSFFHHLTSKRIKQLV